MAANDRTFTPDRMTGPELIDLKDHYWPTMKLTRQNAQEERRLLAGEIQAQFPENFMLAGAESYRADSLQKYMVPQRTLQDVVSDRPRISIPLGPKGLGITAQRLTTKVEQPLNSIMEHPTNGFRWPELADIVMFEGFGVGITVTDPSDWTLRPSAWMEGHKGDENPGKATWKKRYRIDEAGRGEGDDEYTEIDNTKARKMYENDLDLWRAAHLPVKHRALSIMDCAPIFGTDLSVEGLIVEQEFSVSQLRRRYAFGMDGLLTPTGANDNDDGDATHITQVSGKTFKVIEAWLYDDEGNPYVSYLIRGRDGQPVETRWKQNGELAVIDLRKEFGLTRLPVSWGWGLQWAGARNVDSRALPFTRPYRGNWLTADWLKTCLNVSMLWMGFPALIVQRHEGAVSIESIDGTDEQKKPVIVMPMTMTEVDGTVTNVGGQAVSSDIWQAIRMNLGEVDESAPGSSKGGDSSGFAMSLSEAFDKIALTSVRTTLGKMYEDHGSFVLEAGKQMPEKGKQKGGTKYPPILVYRATDVPTSDKAGSDDQRHEPQELDPDLIDETYTVKAIYPKSMSLPEKQQSMEEVERRLKTRRKHLEDSGDLAPETTELELIAEDQRALPEYQKYLMQLVSQIQGAEELEEIAKGQGEGLMDDSGNPAGAAAGVMPELPPGMAPPGIPGAATPGVPQGGQVTGLGGPTTGQAVLSSVTGAALQNGPINNAAAAGGVIPPGLPTPGGV